MNDIPLKILSTEQKEDGLYVTAEFPRDPDSAPVQSDDDIREVPPLTRAEMNDLLEKEGLSVRVRDEPKTEDDIHAARQAAAYAAGTSEVANSSPSRNNQHMARVFQSAGKQKTVMNPNKDRSLSGKARRKARKGR